jgi:K+-sensing histidine kinase KdpD
MKKPTSAPKPLTGPSNSCSVWIAKRTGYGLGSSISKRIVEAHGTIAVENSRQRGASFVGTLPKAG